MSYPEEVKRAIQIAQALAKEYNHETFGPPHLMQGILHNEIGLASWLGVMGKDIMYMREWAEIRLEGYPRGSKSVESPAADAQSKTVLELAELIAMQLNRDFVDAVSVMGALLKPGAGFPADQLKSFPVTQKEIMDVALEDKIITDAVKEGTSNAANNGQPAPLGQAALYKFCIDKTALASEGKLDPIIGRDKELRMMLEVLARRTKPNVIITGEPGVGKTALVDGFAQLLNEGKVPAQFLEAKIYELDTGALIAGAAYKGEVEDRLRSIIKELKQFDKAILFIDEIHLLLDSRGSIGTGAVNLLKPELARGDLTVIGATTNEEHRKYIESDEAFNRRFEIVRVEEPDLETTVKMLHRIMPAYEKHHGLTIDTPAIKEAASLAKRYSKDRRLPDSAVDLMDRTMAAIRMLGETSVRELEAIQGELEKLLLEENEELDLLDKLKWFHREMKDKISPILVNQLEAPLNDEELLLTTSYVSYLRKSLEKMLELGAEKKEIVSKNDVAAVISHKTGIPLGKIQSKERDKLMSIEDVLGKRVIGQNQAIKVVSDAILESRSGLIKAGQPIGSFFLLGPTGTGKTELAKTMADFLFNDESFLIRFDMSEFKEEHSAALLYGAPPGYVGYEEGGMLVNKIREKPYSVVLFDEIEKAHPSVFDLFLQILDEGKLHDRLGKEGDFSNAIILFTSNIGSEFVTERFNKGEVPSATDMMEIMARHFRPEFLARLTEIVPFGPISEDMAVRIFDIQLKSLTEPLAKQGITLTISKEAKKHLALTGFTPKYGARQIKGVIRNQLRRPISKKIVSGELVKGHNLHLNLGSENELIWDSVTESQPMGDLVPS